MMLIRDAAENVGSEEDLLFDELVTEEKVEAKPEPDRRARQVVVALAVVLFLLVGSGLLVLRAVQWESDEAVQNRALTDVAATTEVSGQVSDALTKIFSYRYDAPTPTEQAAAQSLVGDAKSQYDQLFAQLRQRASGQKLTLSAKVVVAGVQSLRGSEARLLVFVDQSSLRAADKKRNASAAQLLVDARRDGDRWKISSLKTL